MCTNLDEVELYGVSGSDMVSDWMGQLPASVTTIKTNMAMAFSHGTLWRLDGVTNLELSLDHHGHVGAVDHTMDAVRF